MPQAPVRQECTADLDGTAWRLSPAQADNAALISAVSVRRGMPARAATIALATALQESRLINIDYGDRDSVGLFQQRTSQGWGTVAEIMDPVYSTNAFFDGLETVPGYTELPVTEAAQAVQRSGFPDAYAQHEVRSRAWASGLTGQASAAVTCTLAPAEAVTTDAGLAAARSALGTRVVRDFGDLPVTDDGPASVLVDVSPLAATPQDTARLAWALAQWGVASAQATGVESVTVADQAWSRTDGSWSPAPTSPETTTDGEGGPTLAESSVRFTFAVR